MTTDEENSALYPSQRMIARGGSGVQGRFILLSHPYQRDPATVLPFRGKWTTRLGTTLTSRRFNRIQQDFTQQSCIIFPSSRLIPTTHLPCMDKRSAKADRHTSHAQHPPASPDGTLGNILDPIRNVSSAVTLRPILSVLGLHGFFLWLLAWCG